MFTQCEASKTDKILKGDIMPLLMQMETSFSENLPKITSNINHCLYDNSL